MKHDKKMAAGTLPFLLARGIGQTYLDKTVDLTDVAAFLDPSRADAQRRRQAEPAEQDLPGMWAALHLAQEMGPGLGSGGVLFGCVPEEAVTTPPFASSEVKMPSLAFDFAQAERSLY
ncbi:hypothetical protein GCM10020258_44020 [Sphingomonas yabuuchiae]